MFPLIHPVRAIAGLILTFILASALLATGARAADHSRHDEVRHFATRSGLHFYAGGDIDITAPADTAFAAGGMVRVSSQNVGEIIAAGGTVDVPDAKTSRVIAMGGTVNISDSMVERTVIAAGGSVKVRDW
jgi:hypothetical protein